MENIYKFNDKKLCYVLKELDLILDILTLRRTYYALVQSVLSYGLVLWGSVYPSTNKPLNINIEY